MRAILIVAALLAACDPFAPHETTTQTVEGCTEAVAHLRACCPAWNSYLSCTFFSDGRPSPDLSEGQSRCLAKKPCDEIARLVERGSGVCGVRPSTKQCH
jgi:hypothetical protein